MSYPSQPQGPERRYTAPGWPPPPRRSRSWLWVGAVVLALAVGGAAVLLSNGPEPSRAEQAASTLPGPDATAGGPTLAAPAVTTSPVAAATLKIGQEYSFTAATGERISVTALKHQADGKNYGVQVRTCNRGTIEFTATPYPWMLSYSGGEELSEDRWTGGGLLAPAFTKGALEPGKCRKGWLNFMRAGDPDGVEYRSRNDARVRWEW